MRTYSIFIALALAALQAQAQTKGKYSFNKSRIYQTATTWIDHVEYDNGLGDVCQKIDVGASPKKEDLVILTEYDEYRRVSKQWLPAVMQTNGEYTPKPADIYKSSQTSNNDDAYSYTAYTYEQSPKDNVLSEQGPGEAWTTAHKQKSYKYQNALSYDDSNDCYSIGDYEGYLVKNAKPRIDLIYKEKIDEDGQIFRDYYDHDGLKVLTRKIVDGKKLSTYYVYDVNDDLLCVIPPKLVSSLKLGKDNCPIDEKTDAFKAFAYRYKYDNKRRCIYKKLPGCEPIYYIYDKMGNCIFTQDGEMRQRGEWKYTIPDKFGRMALAGTCKNQFAYDKKPLNEIAVVASYTGGVPSTFGYKVDGIELTDMMVVMANFYDDYSFVGKYNIPATLAYSPQGTSYGQRYADSKGLLTGCAKAILENSADVRYLYTATYYDYRGNSIQNVATNIFGGTDRDLYGYTYTGNVSVHTHQHSGYASVNETYTYSYDHAGRLMNTTHQVGDNSMVALAKNAYDDLGRLSQITRHGNLGLQTTYRYNVRSWLQRINTSNLFNMSILYNESSTDRTPCYNGNISGISWKSDSKSRGYDFKYDGFSRLLSASYRENGTKLSHYDTSYTYDDMGNILSLKRNGLQDGGTYGLIDNLTYTYQGNQVVKIDDQVEDPTYKGVFNFKDGANEEIEYEYDKNGNLVKDLNKNISKIEYNLLNLPSKITFGDGKTITYVYDASGAKLLASYKTAHPASSHTIAYCGNMIYEDDTFKQVLFDGGYITFTGTRPMYHYYLKDHLGNNRVVVSSKGEVEQVNHYYPYGGIMAESTSESAQRYKYNGKELDRMHGLDWYDYGARWMADGRFTTIDPHAETYADVSPYAYCGGNPISAIDLNGEDSYYLTDGTYLFDNLKETDYIYIVNSYNYIKDISNNLKLVEIFGKCSFPCDGLSAEAYSNILTDVLSRNNFDISNIENERISVNVLGYNTKGDGPAYQLEDSYNNPDRCPWRDAYLASTRIIDGKINITANIVCGDSDNSDYFSTISNIVSVLGIHELTGHGLMKLNSDAHWKILELQREYPTWNQTTPCLKKLYLDLEKERASEYLRH